MTCCLRLTKVFAIFLAFVVISSLLLNWGERLLPVTAAAPPVIISELSWSGTAAATADEWLELYNTTAQTITLNGWVLTSTNGLSLSLGSGLIAPNAYFLIERTDDFATSEPADLTTSFGNGLNNNGDTLFLSDNNGLLIDTANADGGPWPAGTTGPDYLSMERSDPLLPDSDDNWHSNDTVTRNGQDANGNPLNGTPGRVNSPPPPVILPTPTITPPAAPAPSPPLLISEFAYDGAMPSSEGDEFVEVCNPNPTPVDLSGYKVGDGEGLYQLPLSATLAADACVVVAKNAAQFRPRFGRWPDFEVAVSGSSLIDTPAIPNLSKYTAWGGGSWALANDGDELLILGANDEIVDSVAYRNGDFAGLGLIGPASAPEPNSLQRVWPVDTDSMPHDFVTAAPTPGQLTLTPPPPPQPPAPAPLPGGMNAYWGHLHAHTTYSDGAGPPYYALASARSAGLHFYGITDHGWWLDQDEWAKTLTQTRQATVPGEFVALRGIEWTHRTAGHINVFNSDVMVSREAALFAELPDFYTWLANNPAVIAQFNHPDPNYGGTFADFAYHPAAAQVMFMQEIGNSAQEYVTYEPSFIQSNSAGWRTAPTNNGDTHSALWGRDTRARTGLVASALTEADLLAAMKARRVFATEDSNLAVSLRAGEWWMGSVLTQTGPLSLTIDLVDPDPEPATVYLYNGNLPLATLPFPSSTSQWSLTVNSASGHFYWVKVVQADGDSAYTAPIWIEGQLAPETILINEIMPAPFGDDWDGNGEANGDDEWLELFNPTDQPVGLGGWQLTDESRIVYEIPLGVIIPARGFATFFKAQTGFALNNGGDTVTLRHPNGTTVDQFHYDHSPGSDDSWCRLPDGGPVWSDNCGPSPNQVNGEKPAARPLRTSIFEAKRLTYDAWVEIKGRVTASPGVLGVRTMYIQDETSGIMIYLPKNHGLTFTLGDHVRVVGNLRDFHGEAEIAVDERSDVDFLEAGTAPPPLPIVTTSLLEPYEGLLVMLQGQAVRFRGRTTMWLDDGTDPAQTYIRSTTGIRRPFIEFGAPVTTIGIVSQYSEGTPSRDDYRLLLRYQDDLIVPLPAPPPDPDWPALLPETGY